MGSVYQGLVQERHELKTEGGVLMGKKERTEDETERLDQVADRLEALNGDIEREERRRELLRSEPALANTMPAQTREKPEAFKSFGDQLLAVALAGSPNGHIDRRLLDMRAVASGQNETVGSEGGFLVQQDMAADLFSQAFGQSEILSRCAPMPISAGANGTKITMIDETSRATGSRWGGAMAYWAVEAGTVNAGVLKFRQLNLELNKLFGIAYATDENLQDASQLEAVVGGAFKEEMIFKTEDAVFEGSGVGMPLGIKNSLSKIAVPKEPGQVAASIVTENIDKMWSRMHPRFKRNAVWMVNPDTWPALASLTRAVGVGGVPVFMPPGGLSGAPYSTCYGKPVIETEYNDTLGTEGDIVLTDWGQYYLAQKNGIQAQSSIHVRFLYDEMTFRFIWRVDGRPKFVSPLTPFKGSNTLGPIVTLAVRA